MYKSQPLTLNEWQDMFGFIYGEVNRTLSSIELWLHVMEEAGEVAKDMRKEDYKSLAQDLPDVFAWLCSFSNRTGINLEEAVWEKYPAVCPYCLKERFCICIAEGFDTYEDARVQQYRSHNQKPKEFRDWIAMFGDIYGNVNKVLSRASIGFHLMEEIGEVARDLRKDEYQRYVVEVADVFAWLIAVSMKIPEVKNFDNIVWSIYPGICKRCKAAPCECAGKTRIPRL